MKFEHYVDLGTFRVLTKIVEEIVNDVVLCALYDMDNNRSCYVCINDGHLDLVMNKHFNNDEDDYEEYFVLTAPKLNHSSWDNIQEQLIDLLNKYGAK